MGSAAIFLYFYKSVMLLENSALRMPALIFGLLLSMCPFGNGLFRP